ncbi:Mov34/MPN/PAD-1 family protein [Bacillus sp. BAU-SS-2023]|nr:Mov34/MPN/PAD-1 family protein [Bacillus sp. BAU-SS-2023]
MIEIKYKKYKISISNQIVDIIINRRQINNNYEAGGMLIGSIVANSNEIEINDYTEPLKEDSRNRLTFKRSDKHNEILYEKWKESNFTKLYLGEWHTHPQNIPTPSFIDKISWNTLLFKSNTESDILIFIIGGTSSIEIWIGDRKSKKIKRGESYKY